MDMKKLAYKVLASVCALCMLAGCPDGAKTESSPRESASEESVSAAEESGARETMVSVYAGSFAPGFSDGANTAAQFIKPYGLCAMPDGGLLIVDCYANLLRASADGSVTTLAGSTDTLDQGGYPFGGYLDGGSAAALLNRPRFAAATKEGTVVFSDTGNNRIRVVLGGDVRLLAGDGVAGFHNGNYQTARFDTPSGVAVGADGTVYVADTLNHCIRTISSEGVVSTLAGVPKQEGMKDGTLDEALFCEPNDIQFGPGGALYIVDKGNQRIRKILEGDVSTVAGGGEEKDPVTGYIVGGYQDGAAAQALFQYPTGICVCKDVIYVADTGNNCIRSISREGRVATVTGTKMPGNVGGSLHDARFNQPLDVLRTDGRLYISDSYNHVIRMVELDASADSSSSTDSID